MSEDVHPFINDKRPDLKRNKPEPPPEPKAPPPVSAGAVERVVDLAFNSSREKIREVTIVDRIQGRLFPLMDMVNQGRSFVLEIAQYRQDPVKYREIYPDKIKPVTPNLMDDFMYRTAQWQKSVGGINLNKLIEVAMIEKENVNTDEDLYSNDTDAWKD